MGKASSAKKVARAARVGSASGPNERRQFGFSAVVIVLVVLGVALVVFARSTRDAQVSPTLQDHWHNAYGVYNCTTSSFLPPFLSEADPDGIHSHQDGIIHIHPFTASVTGKGAKMGVFLRAMGATLSDSELDLPGSEALVEGVQCDGEDAVLQVVRFTDALGIGPADEVRTDDLADTRFLGDGEGLVVALAPLGADIPRPPDASLNALAGVLGQNRDDLSDRTDDSVVPGPQDFGVGGPPGIQEDKTESDVSD